MKASFIKKILQFKKPGGTSRGVLHTKDTYILTIENEGNFGVGECALFRGLSADDVPEYELKLDWLCKNIHDDFDSLQQELKQFPSIWIGVEQALLNLKCSKHIYFPSDFTQRKDSIKINGLIWMGSVEEMQTQIQQKLDLGFDCIKLKIGTDWSAELEILKNLRLQFDAETLEIRVDANGAFNLEQSKKVLYSLAELQIHSIEQPIKAGNWLEMAQLCRETVCPIALDEELIGILDAESKMNLISEIQPQYIILKPSLVGGFSGSDEWIELANKNNVGWWITSALESNIGLNAIAQYTYTKKNPMPQGLGTGSLFTNNFDSALSLTGDQLSFVG